MVLFEKDFYEQGASLHLNTKNLSFIRIAQLYKQLGIKNNKFMLALYDKEIAKYDPHNLTDPSIELRLRIAAEAKTNIWYVLREITRVPSAGGLGYVPYIANRYNITLTWIVFNDIDSYSTILRQVGKTTGLLSLDTALLYLMETNYKIGWISKDTAAVQECVDRVKEIRDGYPSYLISMSHKDTDNKEGIDYKALGNSFKTFVSQKSPIQAKKAARGLSMPKQSDDEFAYIDNNEIIFSSALAATTKAREQVHAAGGIAPLCIATTAADPTTTSGKYAYELMKNCMRFQEALFDCKDKEELLQYLAVGSIRKMFYINFSYKQLGYDDKWLQDTLIRVGANEDVAAWDYLSIWKPRGSRGAIDPAIMKIIRENEKDPLFTEMVEGMLFNYYVPKEKLNDPDFINKPFILGNDSSENIEKDFCTLVSLDPKDMSLVMTFRCNKSNLNAVARNIFNLLVRYPRMIWVPERNHVGAMIIDIVIELLTQMGDDVTKRIFNLFVDECEDLKLMNQVKSKLYAFGVTGSDKGKFGFRTTAGAKGRSALYNTTFKKTLDINKTKIYDSVLIEQLGELEIRNGRVDHPSGKHDDMVIAYLLTCFFVFFAKHLDYYGIKPHELIDLNVIVSTNKYDDDEVISKVDYQVLLNALRDYQFRYDTSASVVLKAALEIKIKELKDQLDFYEVQEEVVTKQNLVKDYSNKHGMSDGRKTAIMGYFLKVV